MQTMYAATRFTWILFNQTDDPTARKNITSISLFVDDTVGNNKDPVEAYCNNKNNEIHVNASYLGKYKGNIRREFVGIVYHQMAAVWQWNGKGEAPKGLLSGIAEFVRMAAHYGNSQKVRLGDGNRWDQGDGVTARFLEFCEKKKKGFVKELNKKMKYGYTKAYFFDFLGKTVDQLWKEYKAKYAKKY
ncbi:Basic secretory protease (Fragments) [Linum grandiflorum]